MKKIIIILVSLFFPIFVFAHTDSNLPDNQNLSMNSMWNMMNGSGWGWFGGFWMIVGFAVAVLLVIVLVLVILKLLKK